jgi:hypothetical protein
MGGHSGGVRSEASPAHELLRGFAPAALTGLPHGFCRSSVLSLALQYRGRMGFAHCIRPPLLGSRPIAARRGPMA